MKTTRGTMVGAQLCVLLFFASVAGCDRGSQAKLEQVGTSVESWSAALRETADQWAGGRVPRTYVRQMVKVAEEELGDDAEDVEKAPPGARRDELKRKLEALRGQVADLSKAAERNDPQAARAIAERGNG